MNADTLKGQWLQVKGKAREKWGKLTDDDLDMIKGEAQTLAGKIQERYGYARERAQKEVDDWFEACQKAEKKQDRQERQQAAR